MLKPLTDHVVVELDAPSDKSHGGIVIPQTAAKKVNSGTLVAVGPGRLNNEGQRLVMSVKKGDKVMFTEWAGTEVEVGKNKYRIMTEGDILAVID